MKKSIIIIFTGTFLLFCIYSAFEMLVPAKTGTQNFEIEIPKGATFKQAAEILYSQKLIRDKNIFLLIGRLTGTDRRIRAGFYSIWANMSPLSIFKIIRKGQIIEYEIKILEGDSLLEISNKLDKIGIMTKEDFIILSQKSDFLASYDIEAKSIEGYIFPDTYLIPKGVRPEDAIGTMIGRMREKYNDKLLEMTSDMDMTENEVLTLASIIEKEAVVDSERPLISAVYHNRLKKNMLLQADPTTIYGIKSSKEKITMADLQCRTPYNTYLVKGLPPGPIASPGIKSIIAALQPADVPYLYFVAHDDRTHHFSKTLEEHKNAVRLYREKKQKAGKSTENRDPRNGTS